MLDIELVKPKNGTAMETIGKLPCSKAPVRKPDQPCVTRSVQYKERAV